jgi:hypothetical protein
MSFNSLVTYTYKRTFLRMLWRLRVITTRERIKLRTEVSHEYDNEIHHGLIMKD